MRLALTIVMHNGEDPVNVMLFECILCSLPHLSTKRQYTFIILITTESSVSISTHILTFFNITLI